MTRKLIIKFICEYAKKDILISFIIPAFLLLFLCLPTYATDVRHSYDSLNRLVRTDYSNGIRVEYTYDETGNRLTKETTQSPDSENDGHYDNWDNCPSTPNSLQEDTMPPDGNNCGDACECEGDFDSDIDQDGLDAATFKQDFGRSLYNNPCTNPNQCSGDFDCDQDVDGLDAAKFKEDFGRSEYNNPCPTCEVGDWCVYE